MYLSLFDASLTHQRSVIMPTLEASNTLAPSDALLSEIRQLRGELHQYRSEQHHFFLVVRELISSVKQIIVGSLDDKALRAEEAWEEASLSRTMFYDIQNPKHTSFDESFPPFFRVLGMKRWWRNRIRAWLKAHDTATGTQS